ncbi:MAG: condensation domain-containing protein [Candidatus Babeliales bacterium]
MKATIQENQIFIAEQLSDVKGLYTIREVWPLDNKIDIHRLKNAFFKVVANFSKLQTYFILDDDAILQSKIANIVPLWTAEDVFFDMETPPLLAAGIITKDGNFFFKLQFHHALMDGWSLGIFLKHLSENYNKNNSEILPIKLIDASVDYENNLIQKPIDHKWLQYKFVNNYYLESHAHGITFTIYDDKFRNILSTAKLFGVTLLPLLLYKIINFIQKYDDTENIELAIPFSCRNSSNFHQFGMFVETQIFELQLYKRLTAEQATKLIQRQIFTLLQNSNPISNYHGQPQIMVNFLELSHLALKLDDVISFPDIVLPKNSLFDVTFEFRQKLNQLEVLLFHKYNALGAKQLFFYEEFKQHFLEG